MRNKIYKRNNLSLKLSFGSLIVIIIGFMIVMKSSDKVVNGEDSHDIFNVMGTVAKVRLFTTKTEADKGFGLVRKTFFEVEKTCNIFNPKSEISLLNNSAYKEPFKCSRMLWEILVKSKEFYDISEGSFDISAKPLMSLWGFYRKQKKLPSQIEIKQALLFVGLDKVEFDYEARTVKFKELGMSLDLGGIAKGYAVDRAVALLKKMGIKRGIVNLAGNMYCFPISYPDRQSYTIGIRNPIHKGSICGKISVLNLSMATSGNYERYVEIEGKYYTHIMDAKTGRPVEDVLSVTVVTPVALVADALSTAIFIKGEKFARNVCSRIPSTSVLIIRRLKSDSKKVEVIKIGNVWSNIEKENLENSLSTN